MGPDVTDLCADLTDVTLADEDTNSVLTDNAKRAIQDNVAMHVTQPGCQHWKMQVAPPDDQLLNQCKLSHLVAQYATGGKICNQCK